MSGVVEGGWGFVAAAYLVTAAVLGGYAISVFFRWGSERNRPATEAGQDTTT